MRRMLPQECCGSPLVAAPMQIFQRGASDTF
jgi:hypothetical protein